MGKFEKRIFRKKGGGVGNLKFFTKMTKKAFQNHHKI